MHLNPHVMVAKRWVTYKEFVVQSLKLVRRTFLLITSGSEIYNVQFLSTHTVILKQAFWWGWEICWIKVFGHRNSNHLVFQMGFVKSIPILPKLWKFMKSWKKNWWKIEIERVEKSGKKVTSVLFFFLSWNKYFTEAEGYHIYINLKVFKN